MKYSKDAFGSRLEISILGENANDSGISESFFAVETFENNYSRFKHANILSEINSWKCINISPEITSLIQLCIKISRLTKGYFDITLIPILENAWYGILSWKMEEYVWYKNIFLNDNQIELKNGVQIEFWSCGKGYMLDVIYNILKRYHTDFVINFWGDIRVRGKRNIFLEDPCDINKNIWSVPLENMSLASSAGNKRKIKWWHHLIDMHQGKSQNDKLAVYVTHKLWVFADIFATALFVTPLDISLKILEQVDGLEALIISSSGKIFKTKGYKLIV